MSTGGIDLGVATGPHATQVPETASIRLQRPLAHVVLLIGSPKPSSQPFHHKDAPMSKTPKNPFATIDPMQLEKVAGGASRVSSRSGGNNDQLTQMLTSVTDSIKDLASSQNSGGMDPMMMMMMMMMMGGGGGGGGGAPAQAAPPPQAPVINISTDVRRRY